MGVGVSKFGEHAPWLESFDDVEKASIMSRLVGVDHTGAVKEVSVGNVANAMRISVPLATLFTQAVVGLVTDTPAPPGTLPIEDYVALLHRVGKGRLDQRGTIRTLFRLFSGGRDDSCDAPCFVAFLAQLLACLEGSHPDQCQSLPSMDGFCESVMRGAFQHGDDGASGSPMLVDVFEEWATTTGAAVCAFVIDIVRQAFAPPEFDRSPVLPQIPPRQQLPALTLLTVEQAWILRPHMSHQSRDAWSCLYSSRQHGQSLNQMAGRCTQMGPCLILIQASNGGLIGGYTSDGLEKLPHYFGSVESFIFSVAPRPRVYPASALNDNHVYFNLNTETLENGLGMGGQMRHFGWFVDGGCEKGHTNSTVTYRSEPLTRDREFEIDALEVWACDITRAEQPEEDGRAGTKGATEDKFLMDLVGRTGYAAQIGVDQPEDDEAMPVP